MAKKCNAYWKWMGQSDLQMKWLLSNEAAKGQWYNNYRPIPLRRGVWLRVWSYGTPPKIAIYVPFDGHPDNLIQHLKTLGLEVDDE